MQPLPFLMGGSNFHAQIVRKTAGFFRKAFTQLLVEEPPKKVAFKNGAFIGGGANTNADHIVREKRLPAGALDLLLYLIQHRDTNLGHFGRFTDGLRGGGEGRFEHRTSEPLDDLGKLHFTNPNSAAASTIRRAIGAAVVPP